jgi:hypothetical protein
MSWKKHFTPYNVDGTQSGNYGPISGSMAGSKPGPARLNYSSYLPDVYTGTPNRVERYGTYNTMDQDSEVNAALDILAEFCTQESPVNGTPFTIDFTGNATGSQVSVVHQYLQQWNKLQRYETEIFEIIRNVFKYGDCFFIRDPETKKWFYVEAGSVVRIVVNESEGKKPEQYVIKNVNLNFKEMVATTPLTPQGGTTGGAGVAGYQTGGSRGMVGNVNSYSSSGSRFQLEEGEVSIDAKHVVHLSLSDEVTANYPFGTSLLETIFKVYKQKELLEDAIIIYRVQRAPERRVFYVDVGNMPSHLAMQFVERVKNEIHQRRIPSQTGGGASVIDSSYNPLSINEDYFFPQTAEGRGSKVETLPGGTNLGEIDDLRYFTNKMVRGLRIPSSYLPTGADDSASSFNDGRVGTAYIQELRFNTYCERLQRMITEEFDTDFKRFLLEKGLNIDTSTFKLNFQPQNFAAYRKSELDNQRIPTFTQMISVPFISNRYALKEYLGWTDEQIKENERLWLEENQENIEPIAGDTDDLSGAGVTGSGLDTDMTDAGMDADLEEPGAPEEGDITPGQGPGSAAPAPSGDAPSGGGVTI